MSRPEPRPQLTKTNTEANGIRGWNPHTASGSQTLGRADQLPYLCLHAQVMHFYRPNSVGRGAYSYCPCPLLAPGVRFHRFAFLSSLYIQNGLRANPLQPLYQPPCINFGAKLTRIVDEKELICWAGPAVCQKCRGMCRCERGRQAGPAVCRTCRGMCRCERGRQPPGSPVSRASPALSPGPRCTADRPSRQSLCSSPPDRHGGLVAKASAS